ncbi:MAG TPA: M56 family metallopeptidase [Gammaproteobacteria bacterium]|nr:M56 family metallopeptidase [Gammaproteobacteria bacterium]
MMDIQAAVFAAAGGLAGILAKGALLLAVAAVVSFCLRRHASAAFRHAVWHLTFVGLLLLPLVAALGPQLDLPALPFAAASAPPAAQVATLPAAASDSVAAADLPTLPAGNGLATEDNTGPAGWLTALLFVWALGAAALLARLGHGLIRIACLSRQATRVDDAEWNALTREIAIELGLRREVALRCHADIDMPMTFGIRHPVILLPIGAGDWPADKRRLVLLHELAHVRRGDVQTQLVMHFARALHWPNPLAWVAARHFLLTREQACDDRVLAAGARPSDYAGQLVEVARGVTRANGFVPTPAMAAPNELKNRIQSILDERRRRRVLSRPGAWGMAAVTLAIVLPLAALRPAAAEADSAAVAQSAPAVPGTAAQASLARSPRQAPAPVARGRAAEPAVAPRAVHNHPVDPETQIQKQAVFALSRLPAKESVPRLIEVAKSHANAAVRGFALMWLGQSGDPAAVKFLNDFIASNAPLELREKALFGISRLPKDSVPMLINVAKHGTDHSLREKAIFWLGQSDDPRAAEALMDIIQRRSK